MKTAQEWRQVAIKSFIDAADWDFKLLVKQIQCDVLKTALGKMTHTFGCDCCRCKQIRWIATELNSLEQDLGTTPAK